MKKAVLFLVGVLFLGIVGIYAQEQDSTNQDQSDQLQVAVAPSASAVPSSSYVNNNNMVRIQSTDIPARMRSALQGYRYKGWESAIFYRSNSNNDYTMEINDGSKSRTFRFDPGGKPIDED